MTDRPYSIIIVEDNVAVREALCEHLGFEGFEVRGVDDGESLTTELALRPADALVLDLICPLRTVFPLPRACAARYRTSAF